MRPHQAKAMKAYVKLLNPEILKDNLIVASLFIVAYETLRASIIDQLRGFYSCGFNANGDIVSERYQEKVLALDKSRLRASLLWLKASQVINDHDIEAVQRVRRHRNELAHNLPRFIATDEAEVDVELFGLIAGLVTKIDRWWIREVELPRNPDFDGRDVPDDEIVSGRMLFLHLLMNAAASEDGVRFYESFLERAGELLANEATNRARQKPDT